MHGLVIIYTNNSCKCGVSIAYNFGAVMNYQLVVNLLQVLQLNYQERSTILELDLETG